MDYKILFIFIEGHMDKLLFEKSLITLLENKYNHIQHIEHAQLTDDYVNKFIHSIDSIHNAEYIYVVDLDNAPCITEKKNIINNKFSSIDLNRVLIVVKEIEGWYLAGADKEMLKTIGINIQELIKPEWNTNIIDKEKFLSLQPKQFTSEIDFRSEVIKAFKCKNAIKNNKSFNYFCKTFCECSDKNNKRN